jgi:hypothetical protein
VTLNSQLLRDSAAQTIADNGAETWVVTDWSDTLAADGTLSSRSATTYSVVGTPFFPDSPGQQILDGERNTLTGSCYVASKTAELQSLTPATGQTWARGEQLYTCQAVEESTAGDLSIVWRIGLTKGGRSG